MDLRHRNLTAAQIEELHLFIRQRKLGYQPFIFTDTLEVGEGQRFRDGEFNNNGGEVLWEGHPPDLGDVPNLITRDAAAFREANGELRQIYDRMVDSIVENAGKDISQLTFAEFGCNTGYFLHSLAQRGAKQTTGYDFTPSEDIFRWFNTALGIPPERNEFRFAEWDSLTHCARHCTFDEVDVCLSVAVTCHLADPLHHLAFLCSKARQAVFFWCPVIHRDDLSMSFGTPGKYPNPLSFPINFDNDVRISVSLLRLTLERCGFGKLIEIGPPDVGPRFKQWFNSQKGFVALRTSCPSTLYTGGNTRRVKYPGAREDIAEDLPSWICGESTLRNTPDAILELPAAPAAAEPAFATLIEQNYLGFNIVRFQGRYIGLSQALGPVDFDEVNDAWLSPRLESQQACVANSLDAAKRQIDRMTIGDLRTQVQQLQQAVHKPRRRKRFLELGRIGASK